MKTTKITENAELEGTIRITTPGPVQNTTCLILRCCQPPSSTLPLNWNYQSNKAIFTYSFVGSDWFQIHSTLKATLIFLSHNFNTSVWIKCINANRSHVISAKLETQFSWDWRTQKNASSRQYGTIVFQQAMRSIYKHYELSRTKKPQKHRQKILHKKKSLPQAWKLALSTVFK